MKTTTRYPQRGELLKTIVGFSKNRITFTKLSPPAPFGPSQPGQFGDVPGWSRETTGPWNFKGIRFIRIVLSRFWPLVSCIPYVIVIFTVHILIKTDLWMFVFWVFSTMSLMPCTWFALVTAAPFLMENIQFNPIQPCPTMSLHMVGNIQFTTYTVSFLVSTFLNKKYLLDFEHFHKMKTYSTLAFWTGRLDESSSSSESE